MKKKATSTILTGLFIVQWLDFPVGNRAFGGGGWSPNARHRPLPEEMQQCVTSVELKGKSLILGGVRRLKFNLLDMGSNKWLRSDYTDLREQFEFHAKLHSAAVLSARLKPKPMRVAEMRAFNWEE